MITSSKTKSLFGKVNLPGDKSISHRAIIFGALTIGGSVIQTIGVSSYIAEIIQATTLFGALIAQFFFSYEILKKGEND